MPTLYIPVGIPGCGKSHWATSINLLTISTDAIREELTHDANNQDRNGDVFAIFHSRIAARLMRGHNAYADATNLTGRSDLRRIAADRGARTHLILFRNLGQAIARNQARERTVPADVMMHMIEKYERAVLDIKRETYDFVTEVSSVR